MLKVYIWLFWITLRGIAQDDINIMQKLRHVKCFVCGQHIAVMQSDKGRALQLLHATDFTLKGSQNNLFWPWAGN